MDQIQTQNQHSLKTPLSEYSIVESKDTISNLVIYYSADQTSKTPITQHLSASGYPLHELKNYSLILTFITIIGLILHLSVFLILIYQQIKRILIRNKNKNAVLNNFPQIFNNSSPTTTYDSFYQTTQGKQLEIYDNYVTYAFIFHQTLVDFLRILYALFFANRLYFEYFRDNLLRSSLVEGHDSSVLSIALYSSTQIERETILKNLTSKSVYYRMDNFYENYCSPMASLYSILTMVTIVNILTILISETCRFYDLKFNSSDTSNYCCVLFGILLIWTSSLITISSLMLVGVADSAAPTWNCDLGESESTTRSLVINIVWFGLVTFIILIAFSYSVSLYRELTQLDNLDNRFCLYTINASLLALKSEYLERQIKIVKQTTKRLFILTMLICLFCFTFLPNFVTTVLKNTVEHSKIKDLRPFSLICAIINLSNASFNSIILFTLCVKSNDSYLMGGTKPRPRPGQASSMRNVILRVIFPKKYSRNLNLNEDENGIDSSMSLAQVEIKDNQLEDSSGSVFDCNEECMQLKNMSNSSHKVQSPSPNKSSSVLNSPNVKEFYSKVGNRLGNAN